MKSKLIAPILIITTIIILMSACKQEPTISNKYIIELIGSDLDHAKIKLLAEENGVTNTSLYQWKNHIVIYSQISNINNLKQQLAKEFPAIQVKIYDKPFYDFTKAEHCKNTQIAADWKHIILTANLVADETMQQEYLDYHATQFEEWPEIAQGFCNADFQQLLLYKNGRQLMLIISIPADKTLDELNPKTTKNNPRVDDWNQIMGKYQEGIEGTKPDEKWVFLTKKE